MVNVTIYSSTMDPMGKASPVFKTVFRHISITCGSLSSFLTSLSGLPWVPSSFPTALHVARSFSWVQSPTLSKAGVEIELHKARSDMWWLRSAALENYLKHGFPAGQSHIAPQCLKTTSLKTMVVLRVCCWEKNKHEGHIQSHSYYLQVNVSEYVKTC